MPGLTLPPFPDNVPTHPLLVIDFQSVKAGNTQEIDRLWKAATTLGFWYLKNHGVEQEVEDMFDMGAEVMDLPLEEKMEFEEGDGEMAFGYKALGAVAVDEFNTRDSVEFLNVAKDDVLAYPNIVHRTYPSTVYAHMESTIRPFVDKSLEVNNTILSTLEAKLGLPGGTFLKYHSRDEPSGSDARVIKKPPEPTTTTTNNGNNSNGNLNPKVALGAHTDFGSLSFLHNRLGGLQVLVPGSNTWQYIRPLPSHAICNIGDTLSIFSGGILRSNMHRIVPPPLPQSAFSRWSVVFFTRPGYGQILRVLKEESNVIRGVYEGMGDEERGRYEPNVTAREWHKRRKMTLRRKDMTPEAWNASRGMEHNLSGY